MYLNPQIPPSLAKVGHWQGDLYLRYGLASGESKTIIAERLHQGPYTVQRPFYPEGDICHTILLHPPGGLVEGDTLSLRVDCDTNTHCFITTPSAGKAYECSAEFAEQKQIFHIKDQAIMEWFPQEMILYDRSKSLLQTDIHLSNTGHFAGWEMVCLGRPIAEDHFSEGELLQKIALYRDGKPILIERTSFDAKHILRSGAYGLANYQAMGLFLMSGVEDQHLEIAREVIAKKHLSDDCQIQIGLTLIEDVLVARVLMNQSRFAKAAFIDIWTALREDIFKTQAITPRIWLT